MEARPKILLLAPLLAVGLVSYVIVRGQHGEGKGLIARQQSAEALTPAKVAGVVRVAPRVVAPQVLPTLLSQVLSEALRR